MWKTTLAAILTLALTSAGLHATSRHNDNVDAAIGGLITGVILSEMFDSDNTISVRVDSRYDNRGSRYGDRRDGWRRYDNNYRDYDRRGDYRRDRGRGGYYVYRNEKVWIPGHWEYVSDRHGRTVKAWIKGRNEWRKVKVWVSSRNRGGRHCY